MARPYKQKTIAEVINHATFIDFYNRLRLIAKSRFEWTGFPEKVNTRYLEKMLYYYGSCVFYDDDDFGLMVAKCNTCNIQNIYDEPVEVTTVSEDPKYIAKTLKVDKDCVLIRNNVEMIPTDYTIQLFASRLFHCQRSIDVNINQQKFPFVFLCDKNELMTFKKIFDDIDNNEIAIYAEKNLNIEGIKALETGVPFVADKLTMSKHEIWNECMTFLGLNNANTDKKERLITDEANSNNELIEMMLEVMLHQRKEACKQINEMYGKKHNFNVDVKLRTFKKEELQLEDKKPKDNNQPLDKKLPTKEGDDNG